MKEGHCGIEERVKEGKNDKEENTREIKRKRKRGKEEEARAASYFTSYFFVSASVTGMLYI